MRLRTRFAAEITARLSALLPEAIETAWDGGGVVVAVEKIGFKPAGGTESTWERRLALSGVVAVELRADRIDTLEVELLIANLVGAPPFLDFAPDTSLGELSERARFVLSEWRDVVRGTQVASMLRLTVTGIVAENVGLSARPQALGSNAPQVGVGHEGDYSPVDGGIAA